MNKVNRSLALVSLLLMTWAAGCSRPEPAGPPAVAVAPKKDGDSTPPDKKEKPEPPKILKLPDVVPPIDDKKPTPVPAKPVAAKKERTKPTETIALSAEAFGAEIRKNADEAAKKFAPVFVELSGIVRSVGSLDKEAFVTLDAGPESLGVLCVLADEKEPWARIGKGQKIKIRGQWPDAHVQPTLDQCAIVDLGTSTLQELKSDALADEFAKNKDAARTKYQEKSLIVSGLIIDMKKNELGAVRLILHGAGDTKVDCGFNALDRAEAEAQKVGTAVRLAGEFSALESERGPALRGCRVISGK